MPSLFFDVSNITHTFGKIITVNGQTWTAYEVPYTCRNDTIEPDNWHVYYQPLYTDVDMRISTGEGQPR